jgi:8-oxo-dGTP pyrophosphatase MutT (NUDIX family)
MKELPPFIDRIKESVLVPAGEAKPVREEGLRPAAVLIPFVFEEDNWKLLFIHRAESDGMHGGQVAFPGGGMEPDDKDLVDTALRETEEEIGIKRTTVQVLGCLPTVRSVSMYQVTPIVGLLDWPQKVILDGCEVSNVFTIEVDWLADTNNWKEREVSLPVHGKTKSIFYNEYKGEVLWGLTARLTQNLLKHQ